MFEEGIGVLYQNYPEAAQWFRKCASSGNWQGQMSLGGLYIEGKGVPKDLVSAYMWLNLAAATAPQNALVSMGNNIAKERDILAAMMTPEQIAEAQRLSRAWKPGKE
jgi:TPR repeat protein